MAAVFPVGLIEPAFPAPGRFAKEVLLLPLGRFVEEALFPPLGRFAKEVLLFPFGRLAGFAFAMDAPGFTLFAFGRAPW